jgi:hypothetical protein
MQVNYMTVSRCVTDFVRNWSLGGGSMRITVVTMLLCAVTASAFAGCPDGFTFNTTLKKCEIIPSCPETFSLHAEHTVCQASPNEGKCPPAASYNIMEKMCETDIICPSGTQFDNTIDKCLQK